MLKNILVLSFLFFAVAAQGQLFLKIEKIGSPYFNKRIYPGQTLVFKVQGDENWRTSELIELISETQLLVFEDQAHPIDEILFLRDDKRSTWSKPLGTSLTTFGVSWSFYAGIGSIFDDTIKYTKRDAIVTGSTILAGFAIRKLFKHKTLVMGKNYNLRIIDLRI